MRITSYGALSESFCWESFVKLGIQFSCDSRCVFIIYWLIVVVQSLSGVQLFVTPWTAALQASLSFTIFWSLLTFSSIEIFISSSVAPFSFCLQSFPVLEPFPVSRFFTSGGQSIGALVPPSVPPMYIQGWIPLGLNGLISLQSKGLSGIFSRTTILKYQFFGTHPSLWSNFHIHTWLLEKPWLWLDGYLLAKWCLCFLICCLGLS